VTWQHSPMLPLNGELARFFRIVDSAGIIAHRYNARLSCFAPETVAVTLPNFFTNSPNFEM